MRSAALAATARAATAITTLERLLLEPGFSPRLVVNFLGMYSLSLLDLLFSSNGLGLYFGIPKVTRSL
jgi:hypothetical protein